MNTAVVLVIIIVIIFLVLMVSKNKNNADDDSIEGIHWGGRGGRGRGWGRGWGRRWGRGRYYNWPYYNTLPVYYYASSSYPWNCNRLCKAKYDGCISGGGSVDDCSKKLTQCLEYRCDYPL